MTMEEYCEREKIPLDREQTSAAKYLDSLGFEFLCTYRYQNCASIAWDILINEPDLWWRYGVRV